MDTTSITGLDDLEEWGTPSYTIRKKPHHPGNSRKLLVDSQITFDTLSQARSSTTGIIFYTPDVLDIPANSYQVRLKMSELEELLSQNFDSIEWSFMEDSIWDVESLVQIRDWLNHTGVDPMSISFFLDRFSTIWSSKSSNQFSKDAIFKFYVELLQNSSSYIRQGAIIGLANLGFPEAIHHLESVLEKEQSNFLKNNIKSVIEYLRS